MGDRESIRLEVNLGLAEAQELTDRVLALNGNRYRATAVQVSGCHTLRTFEGSYYGRVSIGQKLCEIEGDFK